MKKDFNHIKEWLLPKLEKERLSVERFANLCGLSRAAVYFFMSDKNRPDENTMIKMCRVLGVPPQDGLAQYTPKKRGRPFGSTSTQDVRVRR